MAYNFKLVEGFRSAAEQFSTLGTRIGHWIKTKCMSGTDQKLSADDDFERRRAFWMGARRSSERKARTAYIQENIRISASARRASNFPFSFKKVGQDPKVS